MPLAMIQHPIVVSADDDGVIAATILREHNLTGLPVVEGKDNRRLVGKTSTSAT